ncbi:tetratricopeptide repeat protein [Lentzea sp. PSKA42]|uniref:Tetratricopeptide repeat protein n=1 Tax=Lentzea indica TaxID=2604800 RepID=A0ABX1FWP7_9PSEU|nr:BTAD domain-containing putative transcriptional regulator [Lentzea indica]NKE62896.1 tetratricopeptide repeat protein [Lentzea indica]
MGELRVDVLGDLRITVDGTRLVLCQPRQRAVLAVLAMRSPHPVSRDELIDAVWGDDPPSSASGSLHTYISALRRLVEPDLPSRACGNLIITTDRGYACLVAPGDLREFEARIAAARQSGRCSELWSALEIWRGTALSDVPGPFAQRQRARLEEARLTAVEDWAAAAIESGVHAEVVDTLTRFVADHPVRERLVRLLMLALSRSGRQAEALAAFRDVRAALVEQLGVEPGPELQEEHKRILKGDPSAPKSVRPAQTIHDTIGFVGRDSEIAELCTRLSGAGPRTVVISAIDGTGGIGKTALAVHVAHLLADRFPDGQLFIDLQGFSPNSTPVSPDDALRRLLAGLGVDQKNLPDDLAGMYRSVLAERRVLVLLDNAFNAEQVRPLLPGVSSSAVLVTSRNRLSGLVVSGGAHRVTLDVLPEAQALALLRSVIGHRLDAEPQAARELVRLCCALPLALRVAAERVSIGPNRTLAALVDELAKERLDVLEADETTAVRATFSWSYRALAPEAARMFRLLGLHPGPSPSLGAAAALAGLPSRAARRLLDVLCAGHLVDEIALRRYNFHDLLRTYAHEKALDDEPAPDKAVDRLLCWYLHSADAADRLLFPGRRRMPLPELPEDVRPEVFERSDDARTWLRSEYVNLLAAITYAAESGNTELAARLPLALMSFFEFDSHFDDGIAMYLTGLDAAVTSGDQRAEAVLCNNIGILHSVRRAYDDGERWFRRALPAWRAISDEHGEGQALLNLAGVYLGRGDGDATEVENHLLRAMDIFGRLGNEHGRVFAMTHLATIYRRMRRLDEALAVGTEAASAARDLGASVVEAATLSDLGRVHEELRDFPAALACHEAALEIHRGTNNQLREARDRLCIAYACRGLGDHDRMRREYTRAFAMLEELNPAEVEAERAAFGPLPS